MQIDPSYPYEDGREAESLDLNARYMEKKKLPIPFNYKYYRKQWFYKVSQKGVRSRAGGRGPFRSQLGLALDPLVLDAWTYVANDPDKAAALLRWIVHVAGWACPERQFRIYGFGSREDDEACEALRLSTNRKALAYSISLKAKWRLQVRRYETADRCPMWEVIWGVLGNVTLDRDDDGNFLVGRCCYGVSMQLDLQNVKLRRGFAESHRNLGLLADSSLSKTQNVAMSIAPESSNGMTFFGGHTKDNLSYVTSIASGMATECGTTVRELADCFRWRRRAGSTSSRSSELDADGRSANGSSRDSGRYRRRRRQGRLRTAASEAINAVPNMLHGARIGWLDRPLSSTGPSVWDLESLSMKMASELSTVQT